MIQDWKRELREIETRNYSEPLDWTRAAIIRSCIKGAEIDAMRDAARNRERNFFHQNPRQSACNNS